MIKKMERLKNMAWGQEPEFHLLCLANFNGIIDTVNKVIDTVNRLQAEVAENARIRANHEKKIDKLQKSVQGVVNNSITDGGRIQTLKEQMEEIKQYLDWDEISGAENRECAKNAQDPYTEQRKWIGKLCRFWDGEDPKDYAYGTLIEIDEYGDFKCDTITWFDHCEPVKPDSELIYHGE